MAAQESLKQLLDPSVVASNKKAKDGQQVVAQIHAALLKEKVFSGEVIEMAIVEYMEYMEGASTSDRLASLASATERRSNIKRLTLKAFLWDSLSKAGVPEDLSIDQWARLLFNKIDFRAKDLIKEDTLKHFKLVCEVVAELLRQREYQPEELAQALDSKYLSSTVWSIAEINKPGRRVLGRDGLNGSFRTAADVISRSKKQPIDVPQILEIFGSAPHKFIQTIPVLMRPQLERMHHPTVMECLKKTLVFISENLEWDFENMPTTIENIQKHPGIPLVTEVAKCMSFGELYDVIIRVITQLVLGEGRGFFKCETKLRSRMEKVKQGEEKFMHIRDFRAYFGLAPEAYDRNGEPLTEMSEKSRAHSFIASVILVPFLRGLYEARGRYLDIELAIDVIFRDRIADLQKAYEELWRTLDEKRNIRKLIAAVRKLHSSFIAQLNSSGKGQEGDFGALIDQAVPLGLAPDALLAAVTSDLGKLKKNPKKRIAEARNFLAMSKEAPDGAEGLPPSPWADFFGGNLKTISKILKAAGTAITNLDTISNMISSHLVDTLANTLPIKAAAKKQLTQLSEFRTVVQVSWENARGRLPVDINSRMVELLREVHSFTRAKPKAKSPEHLCLKLLGLTRPFVQEYFRCLYEVDGQDLYMTIVTLTEEDIEKLERTKSNASMVQERALERATGRSRRASLEL